MNNSGEAKNFNPVSRKGSKLERDVEDMLDAAVVRQGCSNI